MDDFGIVYLIETAQQFWSELDDILHVQSTATLSSLDAALKRFVSFSASYHEQFLQSPLQLEHACDLLLDSELFAFHSGRMCEILTDEGSSTTDPHKQLILYNVLLQYGRRNPPFLRSYKRWQPIIPLLLDHVLVDIDPDVDDVYAGAGSGPSTGWRGIAIPIEAKLRSLAVRLLYEVCRASKLSVAELRIFDDSFIDRLFDLVEQTRHMQDDSFNYSVIKLIVALNEQFMVAALKGAGTDLARQSAEQLGENRVLQVLTRRLGLSQTFGENMIFMLNRASRSPEDLVMQLLVLKMLYLLFTTTGTCEYFYTNDLCVLVDVFLRELGDLDEEAESLRHTFLRVLHPLLTKTQLRQTPYKRPQIVHTLESLISNPNIREVSPTTRRLVDRCLSGDWCLNLRKAADTERLTREADLLLLRTESPSNDHIAAQNIAAAPPNLTRQGSMRRQKSLKASRSVENLRDAAALAPARKPSVRAVQQTLRRPSNDSVLSLPTAAGARRERLGSADLEHVRGKHLEHAAPVRANSDGIVAPLHFAGTFAPAAHMAALVVEPPLSPASASPSATSTTFSTLSATSATSVSVSPSIGAAPGAGAKPRRREPPAPPPKRRKPPAVPAGRSNGGATITTIASSLSKGGSKA